jgi:hypothetical protein
MLSFSSHDQVNHAVLYRVMDEFEWLGFAGLERGKDFDIAWILHTDSAHVHLHWVSPRICLRNGHYLNICPPGSRGVFDLLRSKLNLENGWADPDDPSHARLVRLPNYLTRLNAKAASKGQLRPQDVREIAVNHVLAKAREGAVRSRDDVVRVLNELGLSVLRKSEHYVTILNPATGKRARLKGLLFDRTHFSTVERQAERSNTPEPRNVERLELLERQLDQVWQARADFNRKRYAYDEPKSVRRLARPIQALENEQDDEFIGESLDDGSTANDCGVDGARLQIGAATNRLRAAVCRWRETATDLAVRAGQPRKTIGSIEPGHGQLGAASALLSAAVERREAWYRQRTMNHQLVGKYGAAAVARTCEPQRELERELEFQQL